MALKKKTSARNWAGWRKLLMKGWKLFSNHHHHHIVLAARISLTLSRHSSLSFIALGRSSGQHPVSSHSCWMYVRAGRPAFARPCVGIHKSTSLMSSSLLLQMSCMSGSPNLNRFRDRGQVAVQLVSCGVPLPGLNKSYSLIREMN